MIKCLNNSYQKISTFKEKVIKAKSNEKINIPFDSKSYLNASMTNKSKIKDLFKYKQIV